MNRLGLVIAAVLVTVIGVVGFAYAFGIPQRGDATVSTAASPADASAPLQPAPNGPAADAAPEAAPAPSPANGVAPPADPSVPLAIEIPGCVCHSKDPKLVKRHAAYRMNQCAGCHVGGVPTGQ